MSKKFNVNGACMPSRHYMVDITSRLNTIKAMVDEGDYFTINRGRQYGKTTTLLSLISYLRNEYNVVFLDFQDLTSLAYESEAAFVEAVASALLFVTEGFPDGIAEQLEAFENRTAKTISLQKLFQVFTDWCEKSELPVVLMIDEVDTAVLFKREAFLSIAARPAAEPWRGGISTTNNQVFLDFLAQLRKSYLARDLRPAFQSVILAGVHDVQSIRRKIRPDEEHRGNSPWNIAAGFHVDMNFSVEEIAGMLKEYENDYHTGMNIDLVARLLYDYTSGYPVLVSDLCKRIDEEIVGMEDIPDRSAAWTKTGVLMSVGMLLTESNALFDSLIDKVNTYPELREILFDILMNGADIAYNPDLTSVRLAVMYGFVRKEASRVVIANRIFETRLYNYFLSSEKERKSEMYRLGEREKYHFVKNGRLNMDAILQRFVIAFDDLYGDREERFVEDDGRRYFLLYMRPIINGTGNYYIESRTRNNERTDIIIDYLGEQTVVELKIWRGNSYNERGEAQLSDYLDYYHLNKGYMLSFNFNKKKKIGLQEVKVGDKTLIEAVV